MNPAPVSVNKSNSPPANICAQAEVTLHAATPDDDAFLREVFASTRREEFMRTGWPREQVEALLHDQSRLQQTYYREHYPQGRFDMVALDGQPVGRLYHAWRPAQLGDEVRVIDIALLPAWRGAGLGTRLMHALIAGAAAEGLPVSLHVEAANTVQRLYARLGFVKIGSSGIYDLMRREAAPFNLPAPPLETLRREPTAGMKNQKRPI
jgi:ribosomal protein S18 acetylase RimI-like enzyme